MQWNESTRTQSNRRSTQSDEYIFYVDYINVSILTEFNHHLESHTHDIKYCKEVENNMEKKKEGETIMYCCCV